MFVADAHVHFFDPLAANNPAQWALKNREPHWGQLVCNGPQGWADENQLIRQMDTDGVDWVVLTGWYWQITANAQRENDLHQQLEQKHPKRIRRFAPLVPDIAGNFIEQAKILWNSGCAGFGEFLPQIQGFALNDPHWEAFSQWAECACAPLVFHITEPAGHRYPGRVETPLQETVDYLLKFPKLKVILAHWGGGLPFYTLNNHVAKAMANVWLDTAASPLLYSPAIWETVTSIFDPSRILFGSDYPLKIYPGRKNQPNFRDLIDEVNDTALSLPIRQAIFGENLKKLLQ